MKNTKRSPGRPRKSRVQTNRDAESIHDAPEILFEESGPLPQIPPRAGYSQRWVRVATKEGDDARNIARMSQRGWRPRNPETVPASLQMFAVKREGLGGVIGTHDCILMERHQDISAKEADHNRGMRRDLERAVKGNIFNETNGNVTHESKSSIERGRPVTVADD